jgi:hypothetical protein
MALCSADLFSRPAAEGEWAHGSEQRSASRLGQSRQSPQPAQDLIRVGLPIGYDPHAVAADNFNVLHQFPKPGVPLVVINGRPVDGESDWLAQLPG